MNELKKLTWPYFWEQKAKEVMIASLIMVAIIFIPYFIGIWMLDNQPIYDYWMAGFMVCFFVGLFLFFIVRLILEWIKSNWKKASSRAEEKLNEQSRKELEGASIDQV